VDGQDHPYRLGADRDRSKATEDLALADQISGPAGRTPKPREIFTDSEDHFAPLIEGMLISVAPYPESMVQKTGGHDGVPPWLDVLGSKEENPNVLSFSTPRYANPG